MSDAQAAPGTGAQAAAANVDAPNIAPTQAQNFEAIYAIINDAVQAYRGVIEEVQRAEMR